MYMIKIIIISQFNYIILNVQVAVDYHKITYFKFIKFLLNFKREKTNYKIIEFVLYLNCIRLNYRIDILLYFSIYVLSFSNSYF